MIISHKHRFIFIKTKKTAGTSLEIALSAICGDKDVITPISPMDEETRTQLGYPGAQNYSNKNYFNHMSARRIKELEREIWDEYYKFCFERNPWDKVISWYYWELKNGRPMTFDHFMESGHFARVGGPGGYDLYSDDQGHIIVDDVYLYENMSQAISKIEDKLEIILPNLPNAKSQFRDNKQPYSEIYSDRHRELVQKAFWREISKFGYRF